MVRHFSLINGAGVTWDITTRETFATNPSGLGFGTDSSYIRVGNDSVITYEQYAMQNKEFDIMFMGDTLAEIYQRYNNFVSFLLNKDIYLVYKIPSSENSYRMKVYVTSLGKGEVSADTSALTCPLVLMPLSFWEDNIENEVSATSLGTKTINSIGQLPTPLTIEVTGSVKNLSYNQTDASNNVLGAGKLTGTYTSIEVVAEESEERIVLKNNSTTIENPYNYQDLNLTAPKLTFLQLVNGTNKITLSSETSFSGTVKLKWRNRYLSV